MVWSWKAWLGVLIIRVMVVSPESSVSIFFSGIWLVLVTGDSCENRAIPVLAVLEQTDEYIRRDRVDRRLSAGRNVVSKHTVAAPDWLLTARGLTWKKDTC